MTQSTALVSIAFLALTVCACDKDPFTLSPEELAERIRENTPTELPPITTVGANTMGAYIHTDTGRVLFVASGVDRPETALAESLDCEAFGSLGSISRGSITALGTYCRRPEIGDGRQMSMAVQRVTRDSFGITLSYSGSSGDSGDIYWTRGHKADMYDVKILRFDSASQVLSGTFDGYIINKDVNSDSIRLSNGRFDVQYSLTQ